MMDGFGHGWGMGWWWFIGIIIVAAVIWVVVKGINRNSKSEKTPLDMLNERYARGEIDKDEYEKRKKDLI